MTSSLCWAGSMLPYGITRPHWINSLWSIDVKKWYRFRSTLAKLMAWCHQPCTNIDLPLVKFSGIEMRAISQWIHKTEFCMLSLKTKLLKVLPHLPRDNELTHWGRDNMAAIFQTAFSNAFSWMKMYKFWWRFHWSLFPGFQLTIFQHWFR